MLGESRKLLADYINNSKAQNEFMDEKVWSNAMGDHFNKSRMDFLYRQLGLWPELHIEHERFEKWICEETPDNMGFLVAGLLLLLISKLDKAKDLPPVVVEAISIFENLARPLLKYCISFGITFQIEEMRENTKEDPSEIAALQREVTKHVIYFHKYFVCNIVGWTGRGGCVNDANGVNAGPGD